MLDDALYVAAEGYPLLNVFWTMMWLFLWTLWFVLLIRVAMDIFRSEDLNGWGKAGWLAFVIVLPYLGVLVYLIARGGSMQAREFMGAQAGLSRASSAPPERPAPPTTTADELSKLAALHDSGVLTDAEFASQKAAVLK